MLTSIVRSPAWISTSPVEGNVGTKLLRFVWIWINLLAGSSCRAGRECRPCTPHAVCRCSPSRQPEFENFSRGHDQKESTCSQRSPFDSTLLQVSGRLVVTNHCHTADSGKDRNDLLVLADDIKIAVPFPTPHGMLKGKESVCGVQVSSWRACWRIHDTGFRTE